MLTEREINHLIEAVIRALPGCAALVCNDPVLGQAEVALLQHSQPTSPPARHRCRMTQNIQPQHVVVFRSHGRMNIQTRIYGPFASYDLAEDFLYDLPELGPWPQAEGAGVKYITELVSPESVTYVA